jgi:hypothetical protein
LLADDDNREASETSNETEAGSSSKTGEEDARAVVAVIPVASELISVTNSLLIFSLLSV